MTDADLFRQEWPGLVAALAAQGAISLETAARQASLGIVGLVGSIDNDGGLSSWKGWVATAATWL